MNQATAVATRHEEPELTPFEVIERVITNGDLAKMTPQDRVAFYWRTCESLGLNPLTRPFEFISLNNKLTMYARKDATDQLRKINGVSVTGIRRERDDELGIVTVYASGVDRTGRTDEAEGVVSIKGLSGEALANALMKAATKAKRRLTLSLVGLGFLDESEVDAGTIDVDPTTGEIVQHEKPSLLDAVNRQRAAMAGDAPDVSPAKDAPGASDPATPPTDTEPSVHAATDASETAAQPFGSPEPDAPTLIDRLRANAEASLLVGPMTEPQQAALNSLFAGVDYTSAIAPVLGTAFELAAGDKPNAAQAQAIVSLAASIGPQPFLQLWQEAAS